MTVAALVLTAMALAPGVTAEPFRGVSAGPVPAWAEPFDDVTSPAVDRQATGGSRYLAYHRQIAIGDGGREETVHVAREILTTAGFSATT